MLTHVPILLVIAFAAAFGVAAATADEGSAPKKIQVGSPAPDFRLNDQHGRTWGLTEQGKEAWTILAFYPKADTPG